MTEQLTARRIRRLLTILAIALAFLMGGMPAEARRASEEGGGRPNYRCSGLNASDESPNDSNAQCGW